MTRVAKRRKAILAKVDAEKVYALADAVKIVKGNATAKFDETIELAINLGVDPKYSDQMVRGVVTLPHGTGKTVRVAVFAKGAKAEDAKKAGADLVGEEDLIATVKKGEINFDRCIATPDMMPLLGQVAKVLGPKGLMPNPKLGTVTQDISAAVKAVKSGQANYKVEKAGIVQVGVGKASFTEKQIAENVQAFMKAVIQAKPSELKGIYLQGIAISSTMGAGLKLDVAEFSQQRAAA